MMMTSASESRAATLIAFFNRLNDVFNCQEVSDLKKSLIIHVLGADHREGNTGEETFMVFRSFIRYVANKTHFSSLKLVLVGPNLARKLHLTRSAQEYRDVDTKHMCDVESTYFVDSFETFFEDKTVYCEPDLIVCFNAGIWGYEEWLPTIRLVLDKVHAPLLITSYNKHEAEDDEDVLDELMPVQWLWRPERNPRGATTPRGTNNKDGSILKENDYWMCLSGRPLEG